MAAIGNSDVPPKAGSVKEMVAELESSLRNRLGPDGNDNSMVYMSFTVDREAYESLDGGAGADDKARFHTAAD